MDCVDKFENGSIKDIIIFYCNASDRALLENVYLYLCKFCEIL